MKKRVRFEVRVRGDRDLPALLDMLRYEASRVESWDHVTDNDFVLTLSTEPYRFVPRRWESFGITAKVVS